MVPLRSGLAVDLWRPLCAIVLSVIGPGAHHDGQFTIRTPRVYNGRDWIVTVRPAMDTELSYVGVSVMVRER